MPRRDTGRAQSTADVERNLVGTQLTRADLGWRSLLFARATLPPLKTATLGSVLLEAQGLAVFRRSSGRVYVALDYGASGGGHGHPDRLNVLLSDGETRWLDDMGTGSYVDPSLHWYRSTLAHNAPLFNGYQQLRVDGELLAFEETDDAGWVCARAVDLFPGVLAMRTLVVTKDYVLDELAWEGGKPGVMDLPIHVDPAAVTIRRVVPNALLRFDETNAALEDTLGVLSAQRGRAIAAHSTARITAREGERTLDGFLMASQSAIVYRASAPGAPGKGRTPFLLIRVPTAGETAWVRTVWSWSGAVDSVWMEPSGAHTTVEHRDGSHDRLRHTVSGYSITHVGKDSAHGIQLGGVLKRVSAKASEPRSAPVRPSSQLVFGVPLIVELARENYRRSEESWEDAGRPTGRVRLTATPNEIALDVMVHKSGALTFAAADSVNRYDNEHADVNGDGIQFYLSDRLGASGWMLVPELSSNQEGRVRARHIEGRDLPRPHASWHPVVGGYAMGIRVPFAHALRVGSEFTLGLVVNEMPVGRERRRGQLVLGGSPGEFVYLRGDREDFDHLPLFRIIA